MGHRSDQQSSVPFVETLVKISDDDAPNEPHHSARADYDRSWIWAVKKPLNRPNNLPLFPFPTPATSDNGLWAHMNPGPSVHPHRSPYLGRRCASPYKPAGPTFFDGITSSWGSSSCIQKKRRVERGMGQLGHPTSFSEGP